MQSTLSQEEIGALLGADLADSFGVLGMHRVQLEGKDALVVRTFLPDAREVVVIGRDGGEERFAAMRLCEEGVFEAVIPGKEELFPYELEITDGEGGSCRQRDPYSFWPLLEEHDQHLFNEGSHFHIFEKLGAHLREVDGAKGVHFAVWAPSARRVSVVGSFNRWDGRRHQMRSLGTSGLWEIFLPGLDEGELYKFEVKTAAGQILLKSDPYAFAAEVPPRTASVVCDLDRLVWGDESWLEERAQRNWLEEPVAIYEVNLASWRTDPETGRPLGYRELAHELTAYVLEMGFTHVELMPIAEHPFDGSWGYQVTGYFAPTSRFGSPEDFAYFVDYCHQHGIGIIVDWVPGHFPKDAHGLAQFDGTALYEHLDPRQGLHPDWDTLIFNYGRSEVRTFLLANALFWLERFHIDGLRVDAVASMLYLDYSRPHDAWVPNSYGGRENLEAIDFIKQLNIEIYARCPGVMVIAEESTSWPGVSRPTYSGGLGFGFKWNMGWMNDVLRYMSKDPVHRKFHHSDLTFGMLYAFQENFILPLSHDEVVHGKRSLLDKMPGDAWQKMANLRLLFGFMYGHPGKKLLFMGGELGQWNEWNHRQGLDWDLLEFEPHRGVQLLVRDLNQLYRGNPALYQTDFNPEGFEWIECQDVENSVFSFARRSAGGEELLVFVLNFTPIPRRSYRMGVPEKGYYRELINSDAALYGGSNIGNDGGVEAQATPWHQYQHSVEIQLPPLGMLILRREGH
jgi:1,4-alpha-glucan branching enzyme